jgi:hypothetical protein
MDFRVFVKHVVDALHPAGKQDGPAFGGEADGGADRLG